jgi:hypothetical protein
MLSGKTYLKNKESFVIQVDPAPFKQRLHLREIARSAIDSILARIIFECRAGNDQVRVRDYLVRVRTGLHRDRYSVERRDYKKTHTKSIISRK